MFASLDRPNRFSRIRHVLAKYMRFIGPGLMVSVAYMDPGNYSTAVAAGSAYQYKLLFSIFVSNCLAVFLQVLLAKLGAVTGLDLAANCKENLPPRLNMFIYILAEIAIIATDLAEVVGTAIALNILFGLPLFAGVIVTVTDVLVVLMAYKPDGPLLFIRIFEAFVSVLVAATVVCFSIELFQVLDDPDFLMSEVLKGFLPNAQVVDMDDRPGGSGLFLSLAILGATVMPHSLYLGSGLVQARLKDYDIKHGHYVPEKESKDQNQQTRTILQERANQNLREGQESHEDQDETSDWPEDLTDDHSDFSSNPLSVDAPSLSNSGSGLSSPYRPSLHAINDTMTYTIVELVVSLFTVALFVNSTILIVAGATLGGTKRDDDSDSGSDTDDNDADGADLFTIYNLLSTHLLPTAGFVFALALLCSGQSAGVVCTLAGQMVLEGFLLWSFPPVVRRLVTRALAIAPCLLVVSFSGRAGLAKTLNALQVVLSVLLPVVIAPLIWFTSSKRIMRVPNIVRLDGTDTLFENDQTLLQGKSLPFNVSDAAIRLQTLRSAHPCAGWEDSEDDNEHHNLLGSSTAEPSAAEPAPLATPAEPENRPDDDGYVIRGYTDMSNGPVMTAIAVVVWGFLACLNLFLVGSMLLGYNVPM